MQTNEQVRAAALEEARQAMIHRGWTDSASVIRALVTSAAPDPDKCVDCGFSNCRCTNANGAASAVPECWRMRVSLDGVLLRDNLLYEAPSAVHLAQLAKAGYQYDVTPMVALAAPAAHSSAPSEHDKAYADAMTYGTSMMVGGKHVPFADFMELAAPAPTGESLSATPAQGALSDAPTVGAIAWVVLADAGHVRYWSYERKKVADFAAAIGAQVTPIIGVGQVSDAADGARYRFLRDSPDSGRALKALMDGVPNVLCGINEFDASVDAAIQAQAGDVGGAA